MGTWYIDPTNGNDAGTGVDWANALKTITGLTAVKGLLAGDTAKLAKSPDPYSIGNATWTNKNLLVTLATAQTTNIDMCETAWTAKTGVITVLAAAPTAGGSGYTVGDILTISTGGTLGKARVDTVSGGAVTAVSLVSGGSGYTTGTGKATTGGTGTGCTLSITTVANVTVTRTATSTTQGREGSYYMAITPVATKGCLLAYFATGALDLSSKQKVSFWLKNGAAITDANTYYLALCSDNAGATIVNTIPIPAIPSTGQWTPLNIPRTGGGNLGASINSVALYCGTTAATANALQLDCIIACTTNGLNLQSLISKNSNASGGTEGWHGIRSINGTAVYLDVTTAEGKSSGYGYWGTTETVATYARETHKTAMASATSTVINACQVNGTLASNINYEGGYNTSNGNQDGETFLDGQNYFGYAIHTNAKTYLNFNRISLCRYYYGIYADTFSSNNDYSFTGTSLSNCQTAIYILAKRVRIDYKAVHHCTSYAANLNGQSFIAKLGYCCGCTSNGLNTDCSVNNYHGEMEFYDTNFCYNGGGGSGSGATPKGGRHTFRNCQFKDNYTDGIRTTGYGSEYYFYNCTSSGNISTKGLNCMEPSYDLKMMNCYWNDTTPIAWGLSLLGSNCNIYCNNYQQNVDDHRIINENNYATASTVATDRTGGTGIMWKCLVANGIRNIGSPFRISLAKVAVAANAQVTISCWVKKDDATAIKGRILIKGGSINGIASELSATKADDANTWEQLTLTFTPTQVGVVEVLGEVWSTTTATLNKSVFFEDISVTQA